MPLDGGAPKLQVSVQNWVKINLVKGKVDSRSVCYLRLLTIKESPLLHVQTRDINLIKNGT